MTTEPALPAGDFSAWLAGMERVLGGEGGSDVPCDGCTACCTSSQFVHIEPDETETLAHIPADLLFPAPRLPAGHVLMGYDENGHCPMLIDGACSIYAHRPRTCRAYDCRVFAATGIEIDDEHHVAIARRARRWTFSLVTDADRVRRDAVQAAARYVRDHADDLEVAPANETQRAVLAIRAHAAFMGHAEDPDHPDELADPEPAAILALLTTERPPR